MEEKYICTFVNRLTEQSTLSKVVDINGNGKSMTFFDAKVRQTVDGIIPLGTIKTIVTTIK